MKRKLIEIADTAKVKSERIFKNKDRMLRRLQQLDFYSQGEKLYKANGVKLVEVRCVSDVRIEVMGIVELSDELYRAIIVLAYNEYIEDFDYLTTSSDFEGYPDVIILSTLFFIAGNNVKRETLSYTTNSEIDYKQRYETKFYYHQWLHMKASMLNSLPELKLVCEGPFCLTVDINSYDCIAFKIGQVDGKMYRVKSISALLNAIATESNYKIGQNEYVLHLSDFKDTLSLQLYRFLNAFCAIHSVTNLKEIHIMQCLDLLNQFVPSCFKQLGIKVEVKDQLPITVTNFNNHYTLTFDKSYDYIAIHKESIIFEVKRGYVLYLLNEQAINFFDMISSNVNQFPNETKQENLYLIKTSTNNKIYFIDTEALDDADQSYLRVVFDMNDDGYVTYNEQLLNQDKQWVDAYNEQPQIIQQRMVRQFVSPYIKGKDPVLNVGLMDPSKTNVRNFLQHGLEPIKQYGQVLASEDVFNIAKAKRIRRVQTGVSVTNGLLRVDLNEENIQPSEWADILRQYKRKKKYFQLANGQMLDLEANQALDDIMNLMERLDVDIDDINEDGSIEAENFRLLAMENSMNHMDALDIDRASSFDSALKDYIAFAPNNYQVPDKFDPIFRDYQKDGYKWLTYMIESGFNPILADDMGLGKTLQVLALLEQRKSFGKSLIIAPATLVYNWAEEIQKFNVDLDAICVVGTGKQREELYKQDHQLYITSYDYIRKDSEMVSQYKFDLIILDEAQYIKNSTTKNANSVKALDGLHRLALTGTPIENTLAELWSIFDFLMPGYLYSYKTFRRLYEKPIVEQNQDCANELKRLVSPFILRRVKTEVLDELPEKVEIVHTVEFNESDRKVYDAQLKQSAFLIQKMDINNQENRIRILAMLLKLRQICCDLRLVFDNVDHHSAKVDAAFEIIQTTASEGNKVLLFSSFTSMLDLLAQRAQELGIKYHMLTGKDSKEKRKKTIDAFNQDDTPLFLISLKAGGTGLNLTAANIVIHYDPWWNQSATNQASDRAYRIGQEKEVTVYKLVMHDSLEEKIVKLQEMKQALADEFIQSNSGALSQLSKDEILDLFN